MNNLVLLYNGDMHLQPLRGDSTPRRKKVCDFRRDGETFVSETQALYPGKASLIRRTWRFDRVARTVTITDEIRCAAGLTPRIIWNTPDLPQIDESGITFMNGPAKCRMTFDDAPAEIRLVGGETAIVNDPLPWANQYNGTPRPNDLTDSTMFAAWLKLSREERVRAGGFYTVYVTPPMVDGMYRLTTTIKIEG